MKKLRSAKGRGRRNEHGQLLRADGQIDRRKPPKEHQFQPGQSGYLPGRPKGRKNTDTLVRSIMDRRILMRIGGIERKVSIREAILTRFAEEALKGNPKPAAFLFQHYDASNATDQVTEGSTEQDQAIIDAFFEQTRKLKKGQRK